MGLLSGAGVRSSLSRRSFFVVEFLAVYGVAVAVFYTAICYVDAQC